METEATIGKLTATRRHTTGKGFAHKLRANGLIPAICYGHKSEAIPLSVSPAALKRSLDPGKRNNTLIALTIEDDGKADTIQVMLKDYQIDSLKQVVLHADFIRVALDQVLDVTVPLVLTGKPEGIKFGGTLHQVFRHLPVTCTPDKIPVSIEFDVTALELNDTIAIKDLKVPEGVVINLPLQQTCALVMAPRSVAEEAETTVEGVEGAVPAEGVDTPEGAKEGDKKDKKDKKGGEG